MYSYEDRKRAVELFFQYDESWEAVKRKLGYPNSITSLRHWVNEYNSSGDLRKSSIRTKNFTDEQRTVAVQYYMNHGKNVRRTCMKLGYPSRTLLTQWIMEDVPGEFHNCRKGAPRVQFLQDQKETAVIEMCTSTDTVTATAKKLGVSRCSLYTWKNRFLENGKQSMKIDSSEQCKDVNELVSERDALRQEVTNLEAQIHRLQLERDVLEKAAEILKKDQGIILIKLTNREKAIVIDTLRDKYTLNELLSVFNMAKSSYCYQMRAIRTADKYVEVRALIRKSFHESNESYGYRRINLDLHDAGLRISEKVIRRLMKDEHLHVKAVKKKKYSSYQGEITPAVENIIKRDFHADAPNRKWLTDITEFSIPAGKVYLSPIIDCFDGMPVSWTIGVHPDANLVNTMLDNAIESLDGTSKPIVHSDRGAHYRWPGWIQRMEDAGLTRSMSKKGCSPDNSACEGFFGRLKNEMFYGRSWKDVKIEDFITAVDNYIHWYAEKRRKLSLGGLSPMEYRRSLGLI